MSNYDDDDGKQPVTIEIKEIVKETDKAYLLNIDGNQHWMPKSQVQVDASNSTAEIPQWLCDKAEINY